MSGERLAVDKALALLEARVAALQPEFSSTATSPTSSQALASKYSQQSSALQKQMHGEKEKKIGVERLQAEVRTESRLAAANSPNSSPAPNVQSSAVEKKIGVVLDSRGRGGFIGKAGSAIHVIEKLSACRIFVREGFILVTGTQVTCFTSAKVQILTPEGAQELTRRPLKWAKSSCGNGWRSSSCTITSSTRTPSTTYVDS